MKPILDPTIARPTKQQIFDAVVGYAAQQPEKCSVLGSCAYRNVDGTNACHIGALLTDAEAAATPNTRSVRDLLDRTDLPFPNRLREWDLRHFLPRLQAVHDCFPKDQWRSEFETLATEHKLDTKALEAAYPKHA